MASTFQLGTLFDHFCAKMHVGAGIDRERAIELRDVMHAALAEAERAAIVNAFREGSRVLGQTMLEAPAWANAKIERGAAAAAGATAYQLSRAAARTEDPAAHDADKGVRAWRAGVVVDTLTGRALVDDATGALLAVDLAATFTTKRDGRDLKGAVEVHGAVADLAKTATVAAPPAEDLPPRQRTVPEQRELLAGLPTTRALPPAPSKPGAHGAAAPKVKAP